MLRSTSLRVLRPEDLAAVTEVLCASTRWPMCSSRPGCRPSASTRPGSAARCGATSSTAASRRSATPAPTWSRSQADAEAVAAFADRARRPGPPVRVDRRRPRAPSPPLWELLEPAWGPARDVRDPQPLMAIDTAPPAVAPTRWCGGCGRTSSTCSLPACVAMFTEEVGVSPVGTDGGASYRARVARAGAQRAVPSPASRTAGWCSRPRSARSSAAACQVQGVWVPPDLRGRGLAAPGMAAVAEVARREIAPVVSLYVNDFNDGRPGDLPPGRLHRRRQFMSVLF